MAFYRPCDNYDLWTAYVAGVTSIYKKYGVEQALKIPLTTVTSTKPLFAVATDENSAVLAGWYINGPLRSVREACAPAEFAADPVSATFIADWISRVLPDGLIELKAGWVDGNAPSKGALADMVGRSVLHAMRTLGVKHAVATAAEHAAQRWQRSGGRPLPGVEPTVYPDDRYLTSVYHWNAYTAVDLASPEQQGLFRTDLISMPVSLEGVAR